jgi:hypothetical protein
MLPLNLQSNSLLSEKKQSILHSISKALIYSIFTIALGTSINCEAQHAALGTNVLNLNQETFYNPGILSTSKTTLCYNTIPNPIELSNQAGKVIKWQYANDFAFTIGVTDIDVNNTTLESALIGQLTATRYFRTVVQNNGILEYTAPLAIVVNTPVTYNGFWNGASTEDTTLIISEDLTLDSTVNACSVVITNSAIVTVPAGKNLVVKTNLVVDSASNLIIEDKGSLVQEDDTAINTGKITFKRTSTPLKQYDFSYYSSPVYDQNLGQLAPSSLCYSFNSNINNWNYETSTASMVTTKGYIVRAPSNLSYANPQVIETVFNGAPNNGVFNTLITKNPNTTYNLIGNPYPSAIDIDAFLLNPSNNAIVNGTIYLWTHNTAISNTTQGNATYNYTRDDYAKYNITGGVKTASPMTGIDRPTGKIAAGQSFFIETNAALPLGNYHAAFNNSMRVIGNNDQFFKMSNTNHKNSIANLTATTIEKNRVWLSISNAGGAYDEALLGYVTGATDGLDNLYDGKTMIGGNVVTFYSKLNTNELSIQGKSLPFNENDVVPLGFKTTISGDFTIKLEDFDGLFENQDVYLFDKTTNSYYNLKEGGFTFNTTTNGTFENRFEVRFTNGALTNSSYTFNQNQVQIIRKDNHIEVKSESEIISSIQVFSLNGHSIYRKNKVNSTEFQTQDIQATSVVLVKVLLENNEVVTKKVIMN